MPGRDEIRAHAHAKVNLDLRILATRPDGYHELATVFQTLALHDTLTFRRAPGPFRLGCATPGIPVDDTNLVVRAAQALWRAAGRAGPPSDLAIELDKRIPIQAGLGGGSADAAATLAALNRFWSLEWPAARLIEIAGSVGADVPFFLMGGTAEGRGRGDRLTPLTEVPPHEVLLFVPDFGVDTGSAYRWYDESGAAPSAPDDWPADAARWASAWAACRNDLEPSVIARHPPIAELLTFVRPRASLAAMSGSGSAVFALFAEPDGMSAVAGEAERRGWRILRTSTLAREAYLGSLLPTS